jgi:carboxyl-terminal processing protease
MRNLKIRNVVVGALVVAIAFGAYGFTKQYGDIYLEVAKNIDLFARIYKEVAFRYVDEVEPREFIRAGVQGMLGSLDPYTQFMDESRQGDVDLLTTGKYGGVGLSIGLRDGSVVVLELMSGYAAERQGIRIGDAMVRVDGVAIGPENFDEVSGHVKGEPGSFVEITVVRGAERDTLVFELIREEVVVKNLAYAEFYPPGSGNVYCKLTGFNRAATAELDEAFERLLAEREIESVVFDVRDNPGGLLDVAVDAANNFLPQGELVVSTMGRDPGSLRRYHAERSPLLPEARVAIVVNEASASASEILAAAVQDHDRGVVVGAKTFGKGLVQTITPLSYNTSLKMTTARYYTPSGRSIQKIDYSMNNDVIARYDTLLPARYRTDNERPVYAGGGVEPDSIVPETEPVGVVEDLLAKGLIFRFANECYDERPDADFDKLERDALYERFSEFLDEKNYRYVRAAERKIDEAIRELEGDAYAETRACLENAKGTLAASNRAAVDEAREEIIDEALIELAERYEGAERRIERELAVDPQFQTALEIVRDVEAYKRILGE